MKWPWIAPIILAAGIVSSTVVAILTSGSRWLVLAGPLLMAIAIFAVGAIDHRSFGASRARLWTALILGGALFLASLILAQRDPALVASNLPIFGGVSAVLVGASLGKGTQGDR